MATIGAAANRIQEERKARAAGATTLYGEAWTRATDSQTKIPEKKATPSMTSQERTARTMEANARRGASASNTNAGPTMAQLQRQRQQAQVDLDVDTLNRVDNRMKELRAAQGKQTAGDRASDTLSGSVQSYGAGMTNAAATVIQALGQDPERNRRQISSLQKRLADGGYSDGKQFHRDSEAVRQRLRDSIREMADEAWKWEHGQGAAARLQSAADRMQDDSAKSIASAKEGAGALGQLAVDVGVAGTQMGMDALTAALTGGSALVPMAVRSFGGGAQEARRSGADLDRQLLYGAGSAALSVGTEKISNIAKPFKKMFGAGAAETIAGALVRRFGESGAVQMMQKLSQTAAGRIALSAIGEGGEEVVEDVLQPFLKRATFDPNARFDAGEAGNDFLVGAILGALGGVPEAVGRIGPKPAGNQAETGAGAEMQVQAGVDVPSAETGVQGVQSGTVEPVKAGRVTTIKRPYQGQTPVQAPKNAAAVQVDSGSVRTAQNRINGARGLAQTPLGGSGFKTILMKSLEETFHPIKGVEVEGVSFDGKPYSVDINKTVPGKVVSDPNLTAEKVALLDMIQDVVRNGEYVGSGVYTQHGKKQKQTVRYDYFETPVTINGKSYIAAFDVEVEPNVNNYRTHKLIEMDLKEIPPLDTGPAPAATETNLSGPVEGTRPLNSDFSIAQGADSVKSRGTAPGTGTAAVNENGLTALTALEQEHLSSGKKNKIVSTFGDAVRFIQNALTNKQSVNRAYLGKIPDTVAQMVLEQTGVDISGYNAILQSDNVRHIMKNHGDPLVEAARGQEVVTVENLAMLPDVLSSPDRISLSPQKDSRGRSILIFQKDLGGKYITMQAVTDGTHSIQTDTVYIKRGIPTDTEYYDASTHTDPAHNAQSVPPSGIPTNSISGSGPEVKSDPLLQSIFGDGKDGLGAADAGFTTLGMEGTERTSRLADSMPYNQYQEGATAMTPDEYNRLFRYQSQTEAKTTHLAEELVYMMKDGKKTFLKDVDEASYKALTNSLRESAAWNAEQMEAARMILTELEGRSYNMDIESEEYVDWLNEVRQHETATGQGIQALSKWSRKDNSRGQLTQRRAIGIIERSGLSKEQKKVRMRQAVEFTRRINDVMEGDPVSLHNIVLEIAQARGTVTGPVAKRMTGALRSAMDSLTFQELQQFAFSSVEALAGDTKPLDAGEAAKTIQVLNMLSSLKTPGRNLTGNSSFYALDALSMDGAALLDMALSRVSGTRSVAMGSSPFNRAMWDNALKSAKMSVLETALDVDMGSGETMYGTGGSRTFRAGAAREGKIGAVKNYTERVLSALERNNSFLLTVPDEFFKGMARGNEAKLQNLIDQGKIKTDNKNYAAEQADALAKYRTFQDDSKLSTISTSIHDLLNLVGFGDSGKTIRGQKVHAVGVGDLVSPFARVAANLASRGVDYNPVNAAKGVVEMGSILYDAKHGKTIDPARQAKAVSNTVRGITGTAVIGAFLMMLSAGLIRRADDEGDENVAALNRSEGRTGYQFNINGGGRWINGGDAKWKNGDKLLDISSLQPFNELLGVADQIYHDDEKSLVSFLNDDLLGLMYAAADIPVLQTVGDLSKDLILYKREPTDAFAEAISNTLVSSATPNILRSVAQGADDRPRSINREDGFWNMVKDDFKSRIPGLRQTLSGSTDPTGADRTYPGSRVGNFLNSTLNPMGLNTYDQTEQSQEWQRLREATGETGFYPSAKIPKTISGNGISKELNYEERQDFQRQRGGYLMITVSDMLGNPLYKRAGDSGQVQLMTDVRDYANNAAKADVLGPDSVGSWITKTAEAQQKTGLRTADVIAYRRLYLDAKERDSRTANEKVRQAIMNDTRLSAAQKNALDGIILTDGRYIPDEKNVDYSNGESFQITQMSDSAAKHWDLVKDMDGMTPERYGQAWEIYNRKGTKENKYTKDMKLRDLQNELGFSRQEAARLYKLMGEEVE